MKKVFLIGLMLFAAMANAQFGVNAGVNPLKFTDDVGKAKNYNYFNDAHLGYSLGAEYRIGKILGIGLNGLYGKLQGTDNNQSSHRNFRTSIMGGNLSFTAYLDKIKDSIGIVTPFLSAGFGYMLFDSYGDLSDANGTKYQYWSDGSIRDLPESAANDPFAITLTRDYKYETRLTDSAVNYSRNFMYVPINLGLKFDIDYRISIKVAFNYNLAFTDYIDNYKSGGNDSWMGANASISYSFIKKPKTPFDDIDFKTIDNGDYDKDGIADLKDNCLGTPTGVKVGTEGCEVDTDFDGIPDHLDAEPKSVNGALVDGKGVTINQEEYAKSQLEWYHPETDLNNENSEQDLMKQVEQKGKEIAKKDGKASAIPPDLISADFNKDGLISAEEIRKTIDAFFEGETDFTVERINRLIDFFFEQ